MSPIDGISYKWTLTYCSSKLLLWYIYSDLFQILVCFRSCIRTLRRHSKLNKTRNQLRAIFYSLFHRKPFKSLALNRNLVNLLYINVKLQMLVHIYISISNVILYRYNHLDKNVNLLELKEMILLFYIDNEVNFHSVLGVIFNSDLVFQ